MGSPFRSALAKLDDSVQNLEQQLDYVRGGLDVADDQLWQALDDANQSSAALRDLIRAESPDADWNDRSFSIRVGAAIADGLRDGLVRNPA